MIKWQFLAVASLCSTMVVFNASARQENLNISGFGTIATATADTNNFEFRSDRSQDAKAKKDGFAFRPLSSIGVQIDYRITNKLDFVGQFVYRDQDFQKLDSITQMAFLRYQLSPSWQLRAGRVAADIFHFSDTRDVSIAYPWVKVPTEVYGIVPSRSLDGADVSYLKPYDNFELSLKAFFGKGESDFTSDDFVPIEFDNLYTLGIELTALDWSVALKHTKTEAENASPGANFVSESVAQLQPIWSGATAYARELSTEGADIEYTSLYFNRFLGEWELSGELSHIDSTSIGLRHSINGFFNLSYFYGAHTFYALYSFADTDAYYIGEERPDFPINANTLQLAALAEEVANSLAHSQQSFSVGWRWDLKENLAFKAQIERTDIDERGGGLRARDDLVINGEESVAHTLFLGLSFSF